MTEPSQPSGFNWQDCQAHDGDRQHLADEALAANKAALFDALAAEQVKTVTVQFDGYGDSGQIEDIDIDAPKPQVMLLEATIEFARPLPDDSGIERSAMTIRDVLEHLAYDFLQNTHSGWGNNDGAFGDFLFDVEKRIIRLAFNARITESEYYEHTF